MPPTITLGNHITLETIEQLLEWNHRIDLDAACLEKVDKASLYIKNKAESGEVIYGVTTWFGANSHRVIDPQDAGKLQKNLLLSHATGVWKPFPKKVVRLAIILRIVNFLHGHSWVRREIVEFLARMFNEDITPVVPSQWSVWASGDLAPLSHIGIVLLGEWEVLYQNQQIKSQKLFQQLWRKPIELTYKEWLALNNGTTFITAQWLINLLESKKLSFLADMIASISLESQAWRSTAFDQKPHNLRPHSWQIETAENIRNFLVWSRLFGIDPSQIPWKKVSPQDAYSLRCIPQVHGATKNALTHIENILMVEANSVTDNPLIFVDEDEVISAGNFHGQPVALIMDYLKISIAELWSISERRSAKLVDPNHNEWLPAFLEGNTTEPGLHSWFMIPQYVAAALVSENKVLCHPASCDSIPTSANIEDHVSMWTIAARQAWEIIDNVYRVLSIELLLAIQAIDLRKKSYWSFDIWASTNAVYTTIREHISFMEHDRYIAPDIEKMESLIRTRNINTLKRTIETQSKLI